MTDINTIEGDFTASKGKFALVVGRWNSFVVEHLKVWRMMVEVVMSK